MTCTLRSFIGKEVHLKCVFPKHQRNKYFQHQKNGKQNKFPRHSSPLLTRQVEVLQEQDETQVQMLKS